MNRAYGLGIAVGLIFSLVAGLIFGMIKKQRGEEPKYDEREQVVRAKAGNHAFIAVMLYAVLYELAVLILDRGFMQDGVSLMLAIFVSVLVFAIECIWRSAYFALDENRKSKVIVFAVISLTQVINAAASIRDGRLMEDGLITIAVVNPVAAGVFLILLLVIVLRLILDRRMEQAEDEE